MKNIREALSNALAIGGLLTTLGSAVDAVRTNNSSQETQQRQFITDELRNEFHVREDCGFAGVPGSVVCSDHIEDALDSGKEAAILDEFRNELAKELRQVPPDQSARRRFAGDIAGIIAGEVILFSAGSGKKENDITSK